MIYEIRTYRLKTGKTAEYINAVSSEGIKIQKPYLGHLIGYYYSEIGALNEIVHIWAYESLDDRERRRTALAQDPTWIAFIPQLQSLIETMQNRIMKPFPFIVPPTDEGIA
ncbi:NIPSNAP family protein [Gluconobacter japonicus]|uniref:NIPSNAP family protein n=1 Tax=Gluconobacter japonicus TaxID=376620 RepID=UPI0007812502|nr:NIPSNAP family protein [Gluconobacter japonicus]KXV22683.1 NIPSNAP domain containing protein [Gluconobacter japonicus]MDI6652433.1 NIPSNAP family protein [Gluconobacter japonicus]